ncbi:MAG: hypothetical protein EPN41_11275 [Candidimonas sp.]|nr:MAG: hypothetical protein EPN41_11275 [Candidimonas sp.]
MSAIGEALKAVKSAFVLTEKVEQVGKDLEKISNAVAEHEARLIRMEARLDTVLQIVAPRGARGKPR